MSLTPLTLHNGDCLAILPTLESASVDSIVTDPLYELGFMGKQWDASGIAYNVTLWAECLRVLKPGGHLLAFGGTRTYHRMACAIEDAGFEVRDSIHWLYGSGFPKSLDVSKAIDKVAGAEREVLSQQHRRGRSAGILGSPVEIVRDITAPATDAAKQWEGWGTALKPAHEPIVVARKPLVGTVAANVLEHGTGALNIDGCRVEAADGDAPLKWSTPRGGHWRTDATATATASDLGRWPANLVLTHAADCADTCAPSCPVAVLDAQSASLGGASRFFTVADWDPIADAVPFAYIAKAHRGERDAGLDGLPLRFAPTMNDGIDAVPHNAERASPKANTHPTVKPVDLMRWLVRLVTPPGGTVLDPFAGSGTTLVAARLEGFAAVGIEMTADYLPIIEGRLAWAAQQAVQLSLFGEEGTAA